MEALARDRGGGAAEAVVGYDSAAVSVLGVGRGGHHDGLAADGDGVILDGLDAKAHVYEVQCWDGEAMEDDGEDDEEVDCSGEGADKIIEFCVGLARLGDEVSNVLDIEDGTDADGAEIAHKEGFLPVTNHLGHELVGNKYGRDAA